jgi:hypothetical protein
MSKQKKSVQRLCGECHQPLDVADTRVKYHPARKAVARQKQLAKLNDRRREMECPHCHEKVVLVPPSKRRKTVAKQVNPEQITRDRIEQIQKEIHAKQAEQQSLRDQLPKTEDEPREEDASQRTDSET